MKRFVLGVTLIVTLVFAPSARGDDKKKPEEVIYGHKLGVALTMDVHRPEKPNGAAIVYAMSGGWVSNRLVPSAPVLKPFVERGYTGFGVYHGAQPKFQIPEILQDMHRAIRFIRHNASRFGIDPNRIGMAGGSAGGHLSLMMGTTGGPGDPKAKDPIDRESSAVQCVACFFPPTDFLNYGKPGEDAVGVGILKNYAAAFGRADIRTPEARQKLGKQISPFNFITDKTPPTLISHGDADKLVPYQQAEIFIKKCEEMKVPAKLLRREGAAHGGAKFAGDLTLFADWFDEHLGGKKTEK